MPDYGAAQPGAANKGQAKNGGRAARRAVNASLAAGDYRPEPRERFCAGIKRNGQRCGKAPLAYGKYCRFHGGGNTGAQARNRALQREISLTVDALHKLGLEPQERDPREVLLEAVYTSASMAQALQGLVRDLTEKHLEGIGELDFQPDGEGGVVPVPDRKGSIAEARLTLLGTWTDRAARVAKMALDAGIEERMVRLAESQAQVIVRTLRAVLEQLDLTPTQLAKAQELAASEFRLLAARPALALPSTSVAETSNRRRRTE